MSSRLQKTNGACVAALMAATCLTPPARAQTSFIAPDGHNRYPGVTIFCPSGNGVAPCVFGGGGGGSGGGGAVTVNLGTAGAVSASNRFPVTDPALDALISGGALSITGSVALLGTPAVSLGASTYTVGGVTQAGPWTVSLGSGGSTIGTVGLAGGASVSLGAGTSLIGTVTVTGSGGAVSQGGSWTVGLTSGSTVGVSSLPALPAGSNAIGTVGLAGRVRRGAGHRQQHDRYGHGGQSGRRRGQFGHRERRLDGRADRRHQRRGVVPARLARRRQHDRRGQPGRQLDHGPGRRQQHDRHRHCGQSRRRRRRRGQRERRLDGGAHLRH